MSKRIELVGLKPTKTCTFILPMCNLNKKQMSFNFINAHLTRNEEVVLIFEKLENNHDFNNCLNTLKNNPYFKNIEENEDEIILYFVISAEYLKDLYLFKEGRYSEFSEEFKQLLIHNYGRISNTKDYKVNVYNAIYPQEFKKKQIVEHLYDNVDAKHAIKYIKEVLDIPDLEYEYYIPLDKIQIQIYDNKQ